MADHIRLTPADGIPYLMMSRESAQNRALSIEARGLLALLLSLPPDWVLRMSWLQEQTGKGRDSVRRMMRELQMAGFLRRDRPHGDAGRFSGSAWIVDATAGHRPPENQSLGTHRPPENPATGEPATGNPPPYIEERDTEETGAHIGELALAIDNHPASQIDSRTPSQLLFEAVCSACGIDWQRGLTKASRGPTNRAVGELREVGATPADVAMRAEEFRARYPDISLTPMALAKHWPALGQPQPRGRTANNLAVMERVAQAREQRRG